MFFLCIVEKYAPHVFFNIFLNINDKYLSRVLVSLAQLVGTIHKICKVEVQTLATSGGALHGLGWATAHPEKLKNQRL